MKFCQTVKGDLDLAVRDRSVIGRTKEGEDNSEGLFHKG